MTSFSSVEGSCGAGEWERVFFFLNLNGDLGDGDKEKS